MVQHSKQLAFRSKSADEDWWNLVFDTDAQEIYIVHKWAHMSLNKLQQDSGDKRIDLAEFLSNPQSRKAHATLVSSLAGMFGESAHD